MSRLGSVARALAAPPVAAPASIVLLALVAAGPSLVNGFVFDDQPIVEFNSRVHTLEQWWTAFGRAYWPPHWGNANYRPLTILSFALQWAAGGGSPAVFHAVSIALYTATCVAVLALARLVLPALAAWVAAALFAVHPVHVEASANIVGQSELIVALSSVAAVACYIRQRLAGNGPQRGPVVAVVVLYAVACFAKETGFLLPLLLAAAELTVVSTQLGSSRRPLRVRARELGTLYTACAVVGLGYMLARRAVLGSLGDLPSIILTRLSHGERLLTMLGVVPEWGRLLLWPAQLSADYTPPGIALIQSPTPAILPGIAILGGAAALGVAGWRTPRRATTFALLWLAVAILPVSNVLVPSGVLLAERTLFLPSVGAMLGLGTAAAWVAARIATLRRPAALAVAFPVATALSTVLVLGAARSASRTRVWRDSDTFFRQVVADAPLGYRAHHLHGVWLFHQGRPAEGERHIRTAIAMYPFDAGPYTDLADRYSEAGLCAAARPLYESVIELGTLRDRARLGLIACLLRDGHYADAAAHARIGASGRGFQVAAFQRLLVTADSAVAAAAAAHQAGAPRRATPTRRGS